MLKDNTSHGLRSSLATVCSMPWHRGPGRAQSLRPSKGHELTSSSLSAALCHELSFTKAEWDSFRVPTLGYNDFVLAAGPVCVWERGACVPWRRRRPPASMGVWCLKVLSV